MPRRAVAGSVDAGMVTAEIAMALPALVLVLGFAVTVQVAVATRSACFEAARAGARAAARGEPDGAVVATVRRSLARATDVDVRRDAGLVVVTVRARPATVLPRLAVRTVQASAAAADEAPA